MQRAGSNLIAPAPDPRGSAPAQGDVAPAAEKLRAPDAYGPMKTPCQIRERLSRLEHGEPPDLARIEAVLADGFRRLPFEPGATALRNLQAQYARFVVMARRLNRSQIAQVYYMLRLAEDALRHGLAALVDAYEMRQMLQTMDSARLANSIESIRKEIEALQSDGGTGKMIELKNELLNSYQERLETIQGHEVRVQAFLNQCERCEAALERAGIEVSQLRSESTPEALASTIEALRTTVEAARKQTEGSVSDASSG